MLSLKLYKHLKQKKVVETVVVAFVEAKQAPTAVKVEVTVALAIITAVEGVE